MSTGKKLSMNLGAIVMLALLVPTAPAMAQRLDDSTSFRYVMVIPSMNGNQRMEIYGFSHEILSPRDAASGSATGKRVHQPLKITKLAGAGIDMLGIMLEDKTLDNVIVRVLRTDDDGLHPYLEVKLSAVKVTSYSISGSGLDDGSIPTETLSLVYDKIVWKTNNGIEHWDSWDRVE